MASWLLKPPWIVLSYLDRIDEYETAGVRVIFFCKSSLCCRLVVQICFSFCKNYHIFGDFFKCTNHYCSFFNWCCTYFLKRCGCRYHCLVHSGICTCCLSKCSKQLEKQHVHNLYINIYNHTSTTVWKTNLDNQTTIKTWPVNRIPWTVSRHSSVTSKYDSTVQECFKSHYTILTFQPFLAYN